MNLHGIVAGAIASVNPFVRGQVFVNQGWTTLPDGIRVPNYGAAQPVSLQVQALSGSDLKQVDGLNQNSIMRGIYLNGRINGIVRPTEQGGDLVHILEGRDAGTKWLVNLVLEYWPDWCKVAVTQQLRVDPEVDLAIRVTASGQRRETNDGRTRVVVPA